MQRVLWGLVTNIILLTLTLSCKKDTPKELEPLPDAIEILPKELSIQQSYLTGAQLQISQHGKILDPSLFDWSSVDERIATVSKGGWVKGLWAGETVVIAKSRDGKGETRCKVTVWDKKLYKFRITLRDKGKSNYNIGRPTEFLSKRSIERRDRQGISITETDLPISPDYLKQLEQIGGVVVAKSKWLNTVVVHCNDVLLMDKYRKLTFVKDVEVVWSKYSEQNLPANVNTSTGPIIRQNTESYSFDQEKYMASWNNIILNNGGVLHQQGFKGDKISIGVIDAGYEKLDVNPLFSNSKIKVVKSFIFEQPNPYLLDKHGVNVASLMAVNKPSIYIGSAPEADYWLFSTDDGTTEFQVEEDYLVNALEYADSVGVSLVNISLSYDYFESSNKEYTFEDTDGKTAISSRAVDIAFEKGMFLVTSAGNKSRWVSPPSDSRSVLTVGAVSHNFAIAGFSSFGMTKDGRIKPDVVSLGIPVYLVEPNGSIAPDRYGTSFSTPIMTGLIACLWQAYPELNNRELYDVVLKSADRYSSPVIPYGHGIPDMQYAMILAKQIVDKK